MTSKVAVLGPSTYSEEAAEWFLRGSGCELVSYHSITDVFDSTVQGITDYSVIPMENTIEGSVSLHIDWLVHNVDLPIQAEWVYPIAVHLMMLPQPDGAAADRAERLRSIRRVVSHPVALAQCRNFISAELPGVEMEHVASTAQGAAVVKERGDPTLAAVGPAVAAKTHGLEIVVPQVQDHDNNFTRFALVGRAPFPHERLRSGNLLGWKTTLLLMPNADLPGSLHQLLSAFAWRRLNLTKIESRPTKKQLGTYYFYIDVQAAADTVLMRNAVEELQAIGCQVRMMGSYPSYGYAPETNGPA